MPVGYLLDSAQNWILHHGVTLALLFVIAVLVPRVGRFTKRVLSRRLENIDDQSNKSRLALIGAGVYIAQMVAYFILVVLALQEFGFSPTSAAIPATVISAALGLGAQSIIADFLAGFFIISEKQFGVGDWVQFIGSNMDLQGDVIQITMRATTIRTLSGETVIVPNSTARVCVNHSNFWARAVVVIPIPLLGSQSIHEAVARSEKATRRSLAAPELRGDITGDLDVHPAVDIQPPTTVGMPWLVDMRFVVQVNPARQWAVERAIRTAVLEEFWDEYGSATTVSGAVLESLEAEPTIANRTFSSQPLIDVTLPDAATRSTAGGTTHAQGAQADTASRENTPTAPQPAVARDVARQDSEQSRSDLSVENPVDMEDDPAEDDEPTQIFRQATYDNIWLRMASLGGRVRPSTTLLFTLLFLLLFAKTWTVGAEATNANAIQNSQQMEQETQAPAPAPSTESSRQPSTTSDSTAPTSTNASESSSPAETSTPESAAPTSEPATPERQSTNQQNQNQNQNQSQYQQQQQDNSGYSPQRQQQQQQQQQSDQTSNADQQSGNSDNSNSGNTGGGTTGQE